MSERERAGESEQGGEPGEQAGRQARKSELGSGSVVWPAAGEKKVLGSKPRFSIFPLLFFSLFFLPLSPSLLFLSSSLLLFSLSSLFFSSLSLLLFSPPFLLLFLLSPSPFLPSSSFLPLSSPLLLLLLPSLFSSPPPLSSPPFSPLLLPLPPSLLTPLGWAF